MKRLRRGLLAAAAASCARGAKPKPIDMRLGLRVAASDVASELTGPEPGKLLHGVCATAVGSCRMLSSFAPATDISAGRGCRD